VRQVEGGRLNTGQTEILPVVSRRRRDASEWRMRLNRPVPSSVLSGGRTRFNPKILVAGDSGAKVQMG
jgi:hypothetical protein